MMISSCLGVLISDGQTDRQTDICDCRVAFATENIMFVINKCTGLFTELNCKWKSFKVDQAIYFRE